MNLRRLALGLLLALAPVALMGQASPPPANSAIPVFGGVSILSGPGTNANNPLYVTGGTGGGGGGTASSVTLLSGTATFGSIANTAFGISGALPSGGNTIGGVYLTAGGLGGSAGNPLFVSGGSGSSGPVGNDGASSTTAAYVQGVAGGNSVGVTIAGGPGSSTGAPLPIAIGAGIGSTSGNPLYVSGGGGGGGSTVFPYGMTADNQTPTAASGVGIMAFDGTNVDRLQDTAGSLNTQITGSIALPLAAGTNAIGTVGFTAGSRGLTTALPLYTQCVSGCSGGTGGSGSAPATFTTQISSSSASTVCPGGTSTSPGTCTIMSMSVGCIAGSATTCTGALAQNNIGGIFDTTSTTASNISTGASEVYPFGALGGSTGYQTVQPWGSSGYTCQVGCVIAAGSGFSAGVVLFVSGHS